MTLGKQKGLSPRQTDVLVLMARGYTRAMIGEELSLSEGTVRTHAANIYAKLDVHSKQELMDLVLRDETP